MRRAPKVLFALAFALTLAACGQPSSTATSTENEAPPPAAVPEMTPEQITTEVAALPAPYNTADYGAGQRVFNQCRACHAITLDGGNRVGPNLHGVMGRPVGSVPGFSYSDALQHAGFIWDPDKIDRWVSGPQAFIPNNRMAFAGVKDPVQRRNLIAYIMVEGAR